MESERLNYFLPRVLDLTRCYVKNLISKEIQRCVNFLVKFKNKISFAANIGGCITHIILNPKLYHLWITTMRRSPWFPCRKLYISFQRIFWESLINSRNASCTWLLFSRIHEWFRKIKMYKFFDAKFFILKGYKFLWKWWEIMEEKKRRTQTTRKVYNCTRRLLHEHMGQESFFRNLQFLRELVLLLQIFQTFSNFKIFYFCYEITQAIYAI